MERILLNGSGLGIPYFLASSGVMRTCWLLVFGCCGTEVSPEGSTTELSAAEDWGSESVDSLTGRKPGLTG